MSNLTYDDNETYTKYFTQPNLTCDTGPTTALSSPWLQASVYILYTSIYIIALIGNGLVCYVVYSSPRMRTVTNYFIVNLAVGDILMALFCIPFASLTVLIFQHWPFGGPMCRIVSYAQATSVFVSAYTLVAISLDRYMAIMWPLKPRLSKRQASLVIAGVWLVAAITGLPIAVLSKLKQPSDQFELCDRYHCQEDWEDLELKLYYGMALMTLQYLIPLTVLVFTYTRIAIVVWGKKIPGEAENNRDMRVARSKYKMIKMMVTVVIVFTVCWLPYNVLMVTMDLNESIGAWPPTPYLWFAFHWLAMSHACYNPVIYCWMNARFRAGFCSAFAYIGCPRGVLKSGNSLRRGPSSGVNMAHTGLAAYTVCAVPLGKKEHQKKRHENKTHANKKHAKPAKEQSVKPPSTPVVNEQFVTPPSPSLVNEQFVTPPSPPFPNDDLVKPPSLPIATQQFVKPQFYSFTNQELSNQSPQSNDMAAPPCDLKTHLHRLLDLITNAISNKIDETDFHSLLRRIEFVYNFGKKLFDFSSIFMDDIKETFDTVNLLSDEDNNQSDGSNEFDLSITNQDIKNHIKAFLNKTLDSENNGLNTNGSDSGSITDWLDALKTPLDVNGDSLSLNNNFLDALKKPLDFDKDILDSLKTPEDSNSTSLDSHNQFLDALKKPLDLGNTILDALKKPLDLSQTPMSSNNLNKVSNDFKSFSNSTQNSLDKISQLIAVIKKPFESSNNFFDSLKERFNLGRNPSETGSHRWGFGSLFHRESPPDQVVTQEPTNPLGVQVGGVEATIQIPLVNTNPDNCEDFGNQEVHDENNQDKKDKDNYSSDPQGETTGPMFTSSGGSSGAMF